MIFVLVGILNSAISNSFMILLSIGFYNLHLVTSQMIDSILFVPRTKFSASLPKQTPNQGPSCHPEQPSSPARPKM